MYTSNDDKKKTRTSFFRWTAITVFCLCLGLIYEHFSHGVYSASMALMFLFPLIGGTIPFGIMTLSEHPHYPGSPEKNIYDCGIATLTVGSCFKGALDIYGTTSRFSSIYVAAGLFLTALGLITYIVKCSAARQHI